MVEYASFAISAREEGGDNLFVLDSHTAGRGFLLHVTFNN